MAIPKKRDKIVWEETKSSGLTHICYKPEGEELWIAYGSGNVYRFMGVPKRWYDELVKSAKPAQFVQKRLKNRFKMQRIHGFKPII